MTSGSCAGVILAGGGGTRLGGCAKGLLAVGGTRIVDRVAAALAAAADELLIVANDPAAGDWVPGARLVRDVLPGNGSLGGVHAALAHVRGPALVVAWDMPFVTPALLRALRATGEARGETVDAVVPCTDGGEEPLCAYYSARCLPAIERRLRRGDRRVRAALEDLRVQLVGPAELAAYGPPDVLFANVNTRDDLARANARAAGVA